MFYEKDYNYENYFNFIIFINIFNRLQLQC